MIGGIPFLPVELNYCSMELKLLNEEQKMLKYLAPALVALTVAVASPAWAADEIRFSDNRISADLTVDGYHLQFAVSFAQAIGLNKSNVDVNVQTISANDYAILNRLPNRYQTSVLENFPVMLSIKPKQDRGFAFSGEAEIEFYTTSIDFDENIRLFRSHDGGTFEDITHLIAPGSMRARGSSGTFSDFILLVDKRDSRDVSRDKAVELASFLNAHIHEFESKFAGNVVALARNVENHVANGRHQAALSNLNALLRSVENANADQVPNIWRSSDDIANIQGEALSKGRSLRFTLNELMRK